MMIVDRRVGRFGEARFVDPCTVDETHAFVASVRRILASAPGPMIFCSDARKVNVFPPEVSQLLTDMMRADNPRIERNALLVGQSSVFGLQIERMFREAQHPGRRAFRARPALEAWLEEALTGPERVRLAAFLAEGG
jgi:hypothetical protein